MKSIMNEGNGCYICGQYPTEVHHCIHGIARRKLADKDGLTVNLCHTCHMRLHDLGVYDKELQKAAQVRWMEYYERSIDEFRARYGKSYI